MLANSLRDSDLAAHPRIDLHSRQWRYMFDNMQRAIDEIYCTCEAESYIEGCEVVISALTNAREEFRVLLRRTEILNTYEQTSADLRPPSLSWDILKSSPLTDRMPRNVSGEASHQAIPMDHTDLTHSWADLVRGPTKNRSRGQSLADDLYSDYSASLNASHSLLKPPSNTLDQSTGAKSVESVGRWDDVIDTESRAPSQSNSLIRSASSDKLKIKLMTSPTRRPTEETRKLIDERQARAMQARTLAQQEDALRLRQQHTQKVLQAQERRRVRESQHERVLEAKLTRAGENRQSLLEQKRKKAADEDMKILEVAWIKQMEDEAKRFEVISKLEKKSTRATRASEQHTQRSLRMHADTIAREEAAQARRAEQEEQRLQYLNELKARREENDARIARQRAVQNERRVSDLLENYLMFG